MKVTDVLSLMGGLSLFLYGMRMMSQGLEATAGNKLKNILKKLTSNPFLGVLVGAVITALIQSSSATTVMVVGFVNSRLMDLTQAVWVIMGANIGTTITGQLIALDIGMLAPVIALSGVIMVCFFKRKHVVYIGEIIAGLGILFIGMNFMSSSMEPLKNNPAFIGILTNLSNPFVGILAGAVFTAIIQSSSASVGILQALATSGLIDLSISAYILFGQNIGTCITSVFACIGAKRNAKRATLIHVLFNVIGTVIFVFACMTFNITDFVRSFTPDNPMAQIANMHTLFNVVTTLILFPVGKYLAILAQKILPGDDDTENEKKLMFIKEHTIGATAIGITEVNCEINRMLGIVRENLKMAFDCIIKNKDNQFDLIKDNEDYIDFLNTEITGYISKLAASEMPYKDSETMNFLFKMTVDIERIGDHAYNIAGYIREIKDKRIKFSEDTIFEMENLKEIIIKSFELINVPQDSLGYKLLPKVRKEERKIDKLRYTYCQNQLERMNKGESDAQACVIYSEMLTDIERISDHILNISEEYSRIAILSRL